MISDEERASRKVTQSIAHLADSFVGGVWELETVERHSPSSSAVVIRDGRQIVVIHISVRTENP